MSEISIIKKFWEICKMQFSKKSRYCLLLYILKLISKSTSVIFACKFEPYAKTKANLSKIFENIKLTSHPKSLRFHLIFLIFYACKSHLNLVRIIAFLKIFAKFWPLNLCGIQQNGKIRKNKGKIGDKMFIFHKIFENITPTNHPQSLRFHLIFLIFYACRSHLNLVRIIVFLKIFAKIWPLNLCGIEQN